MILGKREVAEFEKHLELVCELDRLDRLGKETGKNSQSPPFIADRPHLLMPLGFDEFRAIKSDSAVEPPLNLGKLCDWAFPFEVFFRKTASGAWSWFEGFGDHGLDKTKKHQREGVPHAHFIGHPGAFPEGYDSDDRSHWYVAIDTLTRELNRMAATPDLQHRRLVFPGLWVPTAQAIQSATLAKSVHGILTEIASSKRTLVDIAWRELEEIVAELLRERGLQISLTKRTRDGGRDIIARGELIPGEPTVLAVEVKHKQCVGIEDVRRALRANEDYPALLVATSGSFSAGVVQEKERHRNQLRLYLKDGVALEQWIQSWAGGRKRRTKRCT